MDSRAYKVGVTQNISGVSFQNPRPGMIVTVLFTMDSIGGETIAFGGNINNAPSINTAANASTLTEFEFDAYSNNWYGLAGTGGGSGSSPVSPCGDITHALAWNGTAFFCQAITGSAAAGVAPTDDLTR